MILVSWKCVFVVFVFIWRTIYTHFHEIGWPIVCILVPFKNVLPRWQLLYPLYLYFIIIPFSLPHPGHFERHHARTKQWLPGGCVWSRRSGQKLLGLALHEGNLSRELHPTIEDTYRQVISCDKSICTLQITDTTGSHQFSRHAASVHHQRPCLHLSLLHHQQTVSGGAQAHLRADLPD